jgi:isoleucyl-tRNA synthetase
MQQLPEKHDFPSAEEGVLSYWKKIDAFKQSVKRSEEEGRPHYTFYDGPPFATGLPHYGHILAGTIKDTVTRYAHQNGFHVERRFGWDCHGLPIEFEIDKELGIKTKEQVLAYGIGNYNEKCRGIVMRYSSEWERVVSRLGRWIDFENDYKTMQPSFMESVWWVFKQLFEKNLVYRGFKVRQEPSNIFVAFWRSPFPLSFRHLATIFVCNSLHITPCCISLSNMVIIS